MNKQSNQIFSKSFLGKKYHLLLRKVISFFVLIAFVFNQTNVCAASVIYPRQTLQQPTIVSSWGIPGGEYKVIFAYIDSYLKKIEKKLSNQNITGMELGIREVLSQLINDTNIPEEIKNTLPKKPEIEGDRAVHINFNSKVYIRYYNPDIAGAEVPTGIIKSNTLNIQEVSSCRFENKDFHYLLKQVLIRKDLNEQNEKDSKVVLELDEKRIRADVRGGLKSFKSEILENKDNVVVPLKVISKSLGGIKDTRKKSFGSGLFVDQKKFKVRKLEDVSRDLGQPSEYIVLNNAIKKVVFDKGQKALDSSDPLVRFLSKLDNPIGKKIKVYILKKNELSQQLGDFKDLSSGLVSHAVMDKEKKYNLFIPDYIYERMIYLLQYEPKNEDVDFILSLWGYHELENLEDPVVSQEAYSEDIVFEAVMQIWLYCNAKIRFQEAKENTKPKIRLKVLREASKLIAKALSFKREYFFIQELDGYIYREIGRITNADKDFTHAFSSFIVALSDLALQEGELLEGHKLVFDIFDLLELWAGKRVKGVMPKKAKTRLNQVIKNVLDPTVLIQRNPEAMKKYKSLLEEEKGEEMIDDSFFPKFSTVPVVIEYFKKYQKNNQDSSLIEELLRSIKKDIPKEESNVDYEQKVKTWDNLRVKVYHFCGKVFMEKNNFNSWMDASFCFEKEIECGQYYPEAYKFLIHSRLKCDRSNKTINVLKKIVEEGEKCLGKVDVLEEAKNEIAKVENENEEMFITVKKLFDEGDYVKCLSDMKKIEKKYVNVKLNQRFVDLKNIAKKLKADKKAAFRAIKEGSNETAAAMLKEILMLNPTDIPVGEANVRMLLEIESNERLLYARDENNSYAASSKPVKTRIFTANNYIKEALRFTEVKGRILRARQRYDLAEKELIAAKNLLDSTVLDAYDLQEFNSEIIELTDKVGKGRRNIEGLPDKIIIKKEKIKAETKKRKKKKRHKKNENKKVKLDPNLVNAKVVPKVMISAEVLSFLKNSQDKKILSNNIISGFARILNNSFTRKKKWHCGKENLKISRMRLGRSSRLFYAPTSDGVLMALFIMRKSDSKYANPKLKDIFPQRDEVDKLKADAVTLDEFKNNIRNGDTMSGNNGDLKTADPYVDDSGNVFEVTSNMSEGSLASEIIMGEARADKKIEKARVLDHCWDNAKIINNSKTLIPRLLQSMIKLSGTIATKNDRRKVVVLLDSGISNISSGSIKQGLNNLINTLSTKKHNKRALSLFLSNVEIRKGEGKELLSKKGNVSEKDIVVLTCSNNYHLFKSLEKKGSLLTVIEKKYEEEDFPQDAYLPLVEVLFLTLIKYMHINSDEDLQSMLVEIYQLIPNVIALDDLIAGEYSGITGKNTNKIIIRLIPDAKKFESSDFTKPMEMVLEFLVKA